MFEPGTKEADVLARAVIAHEAMERRVDALRAAAEATKPEWKKAHLEDMDGHFGKTCVYFILAPRNRVKIGVATDRWQRFATIQANSPEMLDLIGYLPGGRFQAEAALHRLFKAEHIRGEWFYYTQRVMDFVFAFCEDDG